MPQAHPESHLHLTWNRTRSLERQPTQQTSNSEVIMYSNESNTQLRLVLRLFFNFIFILLGLVGSQFCKCAMKLDHMDRMPIRLNAMTGWLVGADLWQAL